MLHLVSNNEWVMLNLDSTKGTETYHKSYNGNVHGLVFIDNEGGNSVLFDSSGEIIKMEIVETNNFQTLQSICDNLISRVIKAS